MPRTTERRLMITSVAAAMMVAGATVIGVQPASAANPDGSVSLVAATGKCIEVAPTPWGNYNVAGNPIQQHTCDDSPQQHWFLSRLPQSDGLYHLINERTMQCLNNTNGVTTNRNPVQQWSCDGRDSMNWKLDSASHPSSLGFVVINARAGKCLDVTDGSLQDFARLQIYTCFDPGNVAQHYTIR